MAMINFKKGLLSALPKTYSEGTFYVTTDERAIYLDTTNDSAGRIRLGDFQEFASVAALTANTNPSTTALYYVADINCLAKWNGSEYVQINPDTGFTTVKVEGSGNAITAIAVNPENSRELIVTKDATYMTAADVDGKIAAVVGEIPTAEGGAAQTVRQYIDAKTEGIASDEALTNLTSRVDAADDEIDALQEDTHTHDNKAELDLIETGDKAKWDAEIGSKAAIDAMKDGATVVTFKGVEEAVAAAKKAGDDAQTAANDVQADVDALADKVGEPTEGKTIVQMIADAQTAATYDDTAIVSRLDEIEADYLVEADKTELQGKIDEKVAKTDYNTKMAALDEKDAALVAEDTRLAGLISNNATNIAAVKEDIDAFLAAAEVGDAAVDTLKEIQTYITEDGKAAADMLAAIEANDAAIDAIDAEIGDADANTGLYKVIADGDAAVQAEVDELAGVVATKAAAADLDTLEAAFATEQGYIDTLQTEMDAVEKKAADNATAIETANGKIATLEAASVTHATKTELDTAKVDLQTYADQAEADAKTYADGLNTAMDARVDALEAIDHDAYKAYADQAETDAINTAKNYADSLSDNYDPAGSAAGAETRANAHAETQASIAETNAKTYAADLVTWGTF